MSSPSLRLGCVVGTAVPIRRVREKPTGERANLVYTPTVDSFQFETIIGCLNFEAMITDLLTIRADRDNYYYGCGVLGAGEMCVSEDSTIFTSSSKIHCYFSVKIQRGQFAAFFPRSNWELVVRCGEF